MTDEVSSSQEEPEILSPESAPSQEELNSWQVKANEYLDGWQRARAEFANYKKRVEREQAQAHQNSAANVVRRFLDVLDDLERALSNRPQEGEGAAWAEGVELIARKLAALLEAEGVTAIEAEGQFFDPTLHEAITREENSGLESGQIIAVFKQGYRLGERVIRPAQVRVAS
ncbi:MAG: nucleotide exchange factor GrpE [Chloroflexi bacterium]|nr:nucleotide exchange factor GrpE [Chloroflexota bacterium]